MVTRGSDANTVYLCASGKSDMLPEISFSATGFRRLEPGLSGKVVDYRPTRLSQAMNTLQNREEHVQRLLRDRTGGFRTRCAKHTPEIRSTAPKR